MISEVSLKVNLSDPKTNGTNYYGGKLTYTEKYKKNFNYFYYLQHNVCSTHIIVKNELNCPKEYAH